MAAKQWIKHEVNALGDSKVQECIHCSELITDLRAVKYMSPNIRKGFPAGTVYQDKSNNTLAVSIPEGDTSKSCMSRL